MMSWAKDEWKDGLSFVALQNVEKLEKRVECLGKEIQQRQCKFQSLEAMLESQKRKTEQEKSLHSASKKEVQVLSKECEDLSKSNEKVLHEIHVKDTRISCLSAQLDRLNRATQKESTIAQTPKAQQETPKTKKAEPHPVVQHPPVDLMSFDAVLPTASQDVLTPASQQTSNEVAQQDLLSWSDVPPSTQQDSNKGTDLAAKIKNLEKQLEASRTALDAASSRNEELEVKLSSLDQLVAGQSKEMNSSQSQLNKASGLYEEQSQKLSTYETRIKELQRELECQRHNTEAAKQSLEGKIKEKEKEMREIEREKKDFLHQLQQSEDRFHEQSKKLETIRQNCDLKQHEVNSLLAKFENGEKTITAKQHQIEQFEQTTSLLEDKIKATTEKNANHARQLKDSQDEKKNLISELTRLKSSLQSTNNENSELKEKFEFHKDSVKLNDEKVKELEGSVNSLERELRSQSQTNQDLSQRVKDLEKIKHSLSEDMCNLRSAVNSKNLQISGLENELKLAQRTQQELSDKLTLEVADSKKALELQAERITNKETSSNEKISHLETRNQVLIDELANVKKDLEDANTMSIQLRESTKAIEEKCGLLEQKASAAEANSLILEEDIQSMQELNTTIMSDLEQSKSAVNVLEQNTVSLKTDNSAMHARELNLQSSLKSMTEELNSKTQSLKDLEERKDKLVRNCHELSQALDVAVESNNHLMFCQEESQEKHDQSEEEFKEVISKLNDLLQAKSDEVVLYQQQLEASVAKYDADFENLTTANENIKFERQELLMENEELNSKINALQSQCDERKIEVVKETDALRSQVSNLELSLAYEKKKYSSTEEQLAQALDQSESFSSELEITRQEIQLEKSLNENLKNDTAVLTAKYKCLEKTLETSEDAVKEMTANLESKGEEISMLLSEKSSLTIQKNELHNNHGKATNQWQSERDAMDKEIASMKGQLLKLNANINELESDVEDKSNHVSVLEERCKQLKAREFQLNESYEDTIKSNEALLLAKEQQISELDAEHRSLALSSDEKLQALNLKNELLQTDLDKATAEVDSAVDKIEVINGGHKKELEVVSATHAEEMMQLKTLLDQCSSDLKEKEFQIDRLLRKSKGSKENMQHLIGKISDLEARESELQDALQTELNDLKMVVEEKRNEADALRREIAKEMQLKAELTIMLEENRGLLAQSLEQEETRTQQLSESKASNSSLKSAHEDEICKLKAELQENDLANSSFREKADLLALDAQRKTDENEKLLERLAEQREIVDDYKSKVEKVEEEAKSEYLKLKHELDDLQCSNEKLVEKDTMLHELTEQHDVLKTAFHDAKEQIYILEKQVNDYSVTEKYYLEQIETVANTKTDLEKKTSELQEQIQCQKETIDNLEQATVEQSSSVASLQLQVDTAVSQKEDAETEKTNALSELRCCNTELLELKSKMSSMEEATKSQDAMLSQLQQEKTEQEDLANSLSNKLENFTFEVDELKEDLNFKSSELDALKSVHLEECQKFKNEIALNHSQAEEHQEHSIRLKEEYHTLSDDKDELEAHYKSKLDQIELQVKDEQSQKESLETALAEATERFEIESENKKDRVLQLQDQLAAATASTDMLREQCNEFKSEICVLNNELDTVREEASDSLAAWKTAETGLREETVVLTTRINNLTSQCDEQALELMENFAVHDELAVVKSQLNKVEAANTELTELFELAKSQHGNELAACESAHLEEMEILRSSNRDLLTEISESKSVALKYKDDLDNLNSSHSATISHLRSQEDALQVEVAGLKETMSDLKVDHEKTLSEIALQHEGHIENAKEAMQVKMDQLEEIIALKEKAHDEKVCSILEEQEQLLADLTSSVQIKTSEIENLTVEINCVKEDSRMLQQTIDNGVEEKQLIADELECQTEKLETVNLVLEGEKEKTVLLQKEKDNVNQLMEEMTKRNQAEIDQLQLELTVAGEKLSEAIKMGDAAITELTCEKNELKFTMESINKDNEQLCDQINSLEEKIHEAELDRQNAEAQLAAMTTEQSDAVSDLAKERDCLRESLLDVESALKSAKTQKKDMEMLLAETKEELCNVHAELEKASAIVKQEEHDKHALRSLLAAKETAIGDLENAVEKRESDIGQLTAQLEASDDKLSDAREALSDASLNVANLTAEKKDLASELEDTARQMKELVTVHEKEIESLGVLHDGDKKDWITQINERETQIHQLEAGEEENAYIISKLKEKCIELANENQSHEEEKTNLQNTASALQTDLDKQKAALEDSEKQKQAEHNETIILLKSKCEAREAETQVAVHEVEALKCDLIAKETMYAKDLLEKQERVDEQDSHLTELRQQITQLTSTNTELEEKLNALELTKEELKDKLSNISPPDVQQLEHDKKELKIKLVASRCRVKELEMKLSDSEKEFNAERARIVDSSKEYISRRLSGVNEKQHEDASVQKTNHWTAFESPRKLDPVALRTRRGLRNVTGGSSRQRQPLSPVKLTGFQTMDYEKHGKENMERSQHDAMSSKPSPLDYRTSGPRTRSKIRSMRERKDDTEYGPTTKKTIPSNSRMRRGVPAPQADSAENEGENCKVQ